MSQSEPDPFMSKFIKPAGTWECSVCMIQNNPDVTKCEACETPKPTPITKPPSKPLTTSSKPDELMAKFMKPTGAWECSTCLVENDAETRKCCACETPRPGQTASTLSDAATRVSQKTDPLMAKFMKPAGCWECDVCMVQNPPSSYKCEACLTPNPNAAPPPPSSGSSGSADVLPKFGSGVVTNSSFKFGSSSDSSASVTSTEGFKFGSSSTSEATGTFKFGTTSTTSAETSKSFVFGQSAAPAAVDEKKKSSENSGFKFQSGAPLAANSTAPSTFGSKTNTQPSAEEKTTQKSVFSQPSTLNFSFGGSKEKTSESPAPLFKTSTPLSTGLGAFGAPSKPPEVASNDDKVPVPAPVIPASTSQGNFSFGSAPANTTGSASIFAVPNSINTNNINSATSSLPSKTTLPFGTQSTSLQQQQLPKPMFGFADKTDSSKNTEAVPPQPFSFISSNEQPNQSTNKTPFATSPVLKRQRDDENDNPSDAKRSFGPSPAPAANPGGFGGFNFTLAAKSDNSGFNNSFSTSSSGQFQFGGNVTNSTSTPFGGATNMAAATPTTTASSFGSPSFNFATSITTPKPMSSNTSQQQPFVFGGSSAPFSAGASSENTFGNKGSVFGTTASSGLFDSKSTNKGFGATSAATTATNAPFVFGSNTNSSFNFSAAGSGPSPGGIYQFSGKQAEPSPAITNNANIYQFGQIPSTNNAPLGANTSSVAPTTGVNFNVKPNFDFSKGVGGDFTVGSSNESSSLNNRRFKKAVRRTKN